MRRSPTLVIGLLGLTMLPVTYLFLSQLATQYTSFSDRWMTLCNVLVVGAVLVGYGLVDGRDPIDPGDRLRYSLLAAGLSGLNSYLNFLAVSRAWKNPDLPVEQQDFLFQLIHPGVLGQLGETTRHGNSFGTGWVYAVLLGVVAGGAVAYYSFRYFAESPPKTLVKGA